MGRLAPIDLAVEKMSDQMIHLLADGSPVPKLPMPAVFQIDFRGKWIRDDTAHTLPRLQMLVGGYLEYVWIDRELIIEFLQDHCAYQVHPDHTVEVYVDEEGLLRKMPQNAQFPQFAGNVVIVIT